MKKILFLVVLVAVVSCKQKQVVTILPAITVKAQKERIDEIEQYVNSIESYIHHINISSKGSDSLSLAEINAIKDSRHFTKNITEKNTTYKNNKIVKVKYRDYLENNFLKVKSFYYDDDALVCIKIYELLPKLKGEVYKRQIYFQNGRLLLDTKQDEKYKSDQLLSASIEQLSEAYQSNLDD